MAVVMLEGQLRKMMPHSNIVRRNGNRGWPMHDNAPNKTKLVALAFLV